MTAHRSRRTRRTLAIATLLGLVLALSGGSSALAAKKKTTKKKAAKTTVKKTTATTAKATATTAAPSSGRSIPDHPVQGITSSEIKVGFVLGTPTSTTADYKATYNALLAKYRDMGLLPANGRDIKPVYFQIQGAAATAELTASLRQACVQFATKDKVAFAMGHSNVYDTSICVAKEFHVPFLVAAGIIPTDDDLKAADPFLFVTNMSSSRVLRNWPHWAKDQGFVGANSKIGVFNTDNPGYADDFSKNFRPQMSKLGFKIAAEGTFKDASSIPTAVQRFKSAGVDTIFFGSGANIIAFSQELDKQNYKPDVLVADWDTSSVSASIPRDMPDGFRASGMTYYHRAEDGLSSNPPEPVQTKACMDDIAKYSGRRLVPTSGGRPTADYAEWSQMMHMCDMMKILVEALNRAPRNLDTASLITAIEATKNIDHGQVSPISFSRTSHDGAQNFKTVAWDYNCDCWKHVSGFRAAYVS